VTQIQILDPVCGSCAKCCLGIFPFPSFPASNPEISYTWKNIRLIISGGVGGVLPIKESTSMVGFEPIFSLDSRDQRLMDVSISFNLFCM
jgi:hypothetical protein